ncbi:MAG: DNA topoisomerase I, partial [Duncaniella sp.]|nr:DNA topoisomerase I [Duncaniella sp.]
PKTLSPTSITLEEAVELIESKRKADSNKVVKTFAEDPDVSILNGRYGVYIACGKQNYKIPKTVEDPSTLTIEEVRDIMAVQDAAPKKPRKTTRTKKS